MESTITAPPSRQIILAASIAAVLIVIMGAVYVLVIRHPYEVLFNNLRTTDAATIVAELDKKKIPHRLKNGGATILVPDNLVDATRLDIMSSDLPIKGTVGFELFNKSDMGLTEFAQKINYQRALQGELARTIMTMDSVDTARVHLAITEPTIFRDDRRPPKASVTVLPRTGKALTSQTVRGIQRLVSAAVPDLDIANVVVLDQTGAVVSSNDDVGFGPAAQRTKQAIEQYYAGRIRSALSNVYPNDDIDVIVWADTNVDSQTSVEAAPAGSEATSSWSPGVRNFRLRVSVAIATALTPQAREDLRVMTSQAMGFDSALGDVVTISTTAGAPDPTALAPSVQTPAASPSGLPSPVVAVSGTGVGTVVWLWLAGVLAMALGLGVVLWRRTNATRAMSDAERADYARRLRSLLAEGGVDAASSF